MTGVTPGRWPVALPGATAHFGFGYDTSGLREFFNAPSGQRDVSMLLDGLYVSDRKNADGSVAASWSLSRSGVRATKRASTAR